MWVALDRTHNQTVLAIGCSSNGIVEEVNEITRFFENIVPNLTLGRATQRGKSRLSSFPGRFA